jgi:N-acetylmuramoyl-L-alanine amidase
VLYLHYPFYRGDDIRALQRRLNLLGFDTGKEDGIFGDRTDRAIREFQQNVGQPPDGIVGTTTLDALTRLRPVGPGPGRASVREAEILSRLSATLEGARIAIDAGHGSDDPGAVGPGGTTEAEAAYLLAQALIKELIGRGADPFLLRGPQDNPTTADRAGAANESGAEILIALHLNSHEDPAADGASCYYFGRGQYVSRAGHRLAELILDQLTSRLGLRDCRTHAKSLPLLRETRMPAVHVEPCFITNPREEALIAGEGPRAEIARALADAIERFFSSGERAADGTS